MKPSFRLLKWLPLVVFLVGTGCDRYKSKAEADFDKGFWAFRTGDYFNAVRYLTPIAQQGHPGAQIILGRMYAMGEGVQQDAGQAEGWLNAAAKTLNQNLQQAEVKPLAQKPMADVMMKTLDDSLSKTAETNDSPSLKNNLGDQVMGNVIHEQSRQEVATPSDLTSVPVVPGSAPTADALTVQDLEARANQGDRRAVHLLIEAYKKGLYGLTPNAEKLSYWRLQAIRLAEPPPDKPGYLKVLDRIKLALK